LKDAERYVAEVDDDHDGTLEKAGYKFATVVEDCGADDGAGMGGRESYSSP
jgi:hypothetical protein